MLGEELPSSQGLNTGTASVPGFTQRQSLMSIKDRIHTNAEMQPNKKGSMPQLNYPRMASSESNKTTINFGAS
jgi:hypothetical protein